MVTDPVADMITRLKNAQMAGLPKVQMPLSSLKYQIAEVLKQDGYVKSVTKRGKKIKKTLEIELIYTDGRPRINEVYRISKPSRRVYSRAKEVRSVRQGSGRAIYSTTKGILTDKATREAKLGGELLFKIW